MTKYFLITNIMGQKYWSYLGTKHNTTGTHARMVEKYGDIYINDKGGWFHAACVQTIHRTVEQFAFPQLEA